MPLQELIIDTIKRKGDFYTSPYLTSLFGEMLAGQLEEMWRLLDRRPFTIVECGAGTGLLCRDILRNLKNNPELFDHPPPKRSCPMHR